MLYCISPLLLITLLTSIQDVTGNTNLPYQKTSSVKQNGPTTMRVDVSVTQSSTGPYDSTAFIKVASKVLADASRWDAASSTLPAPFVNHDDWLLSTERRNYLNIKAGFCAMDDDFCSFDGLSPSINVSSTAEFKDVCLLWDTSCIGNRTLAIKNFFGPANTTLASQFGLNTTAYNFDVLLNSCFRGTQLTNTSSSDCIKYNPPSRLEEWDKIRSWMRSDQCLSTQKEYEKMIGQPAINSTAEDSPSCCDVCDLSSSNADIYYWPEGNVDTSCLSVIGSGVNPLGYGGTTTSLPGGNSNFTYWACSNPHPTTSVLYGLTLTNSFITTAEVTNVGSLTIKIPVRNPWSASPCGENVEVDQDSNKTALSNASMSLSGKYQNIHARTHLPLIPASITKQNGLPVSTAVIGTFTL